MYTEAGKKAVAKYNAKTYDQLKIQVKKGDREKYKAFAESKNKSLTALIIELLDNEINK